MLSLVPIAIVLAAPSGQAGAVSRTDVLTAVGDVLVEQKNLRPVEVDPAIVTECEGSVRCIGRARPPETSLVLVVAHLTYPGMQDQLTLTLLDRDAIRGEVSIAKVDPERLSKQLTAAIDDLADVFKALGVRPDWGQVQVRAPVGAVIEIDGEHAALTTADSTKIDRVKPGEHLVEIKHPDYEVHQSRIRVAPSGLTELDAQLLRHPEDHSIARHVVTWSGLGVAAAGLGFVLYAVAAPRGRTDLCLANSGDCSGGLQFLRFGAVSGEPFDDPNGSGPMIAPLGYSLVAGGVVTALSTFFFGSDADMPWWQPLVGLVAGVIPYAISEAVDGTSNVCSHGHADC